jgi:hypothetical protein
VIALECSVPLLFFHLFWISLFLVPRFCHAWYLNSSLWLWPWLVSPFESLLIHAYKRTQFTSTIPDVGLQGSLLFVDAEVSVFPRNTVMLLLLTLLMWEKEISRISTHIMGTAYSEFSSSWWFDGLILFSLFVTKSWGWIYTWNLQIHSSRIYFPRLPWI